MALILCEDRWPYQLVHDQVYAAYMQNPLELEQEAPSVQPYKEVLAALLPMGTDPRHEFIARLGLTGSYMVFSQGKTNGKSLDEPFSGTGDIDGDGIMNADEYASVVSCGVSIDTFAQVALYWPGAGPLPVAGIAGLGALLGLIAIDGARKMRKKYKTEHRSGQATDGRFAARLQNATSRRNASKRASMSGRVIWARRFGPKASQV